MPIINAKTGFVDAVDPDLSKFKAHGGKLLLYAGWADTGITPENTVLYYESVLQKMGKNQGDFTRLFHGARHGSLRRRRRAEHLRHHRRAGSVARGRAPHPRKSRRSTRRPGCRAPCVRIRSNAKYKGTAKQ
jgi:hypothetical protein